MQQARLDQNKVKQFWARAKKYGMPKDGGYLMGADLGFSREEVDQIKQAAADYRKQQSANDEMTGSYIAYAESEKAIQLRAIYSTGCSSIGQTKTWNIWIPKSMAVCLGHKPDGLNVYAVKSSFLQSKIKEIPTNIGHFTFDFVDFIGKEFVINN